MKQRIDLKSRFCTFLRNLSIRLSALWTRCRSWLPLTLAVLVLVLIRIIGYALPSWSWPIAGPLMILRLLHDRLLDILLVAAAIVAAMLLSDAERSSKLQRFLWSPLLCALLTLGLGIGGTAAYEWAEEAAYYAKIDRQTQQIQEFIDIADEAVWYSRNEHQNPSDLEAFPEILREGTHMEDFEVATHPYATDTMLIDYDSMTLAFCYHHLSSFRLHRFRLIPQEEPPKDHLWSHSVELAHPGAQLTCYFAYRDNQPGNGSNMLCITLTMADGTVYTAADLTDPDTGYNYFVGHLAGGEYQRIEDFQERKNND